MGWLLPLLFINSAALLLVGAGAVTDDQAVTALVMLFPVLVLVHLALKRPATLANGYRLADMSRGELIGFRLKLAALDIGARNIHRLETIKNNLNHFARFMGFVPSKQAGGNGEANQQKKADCQKGKNFGHSENSDG